MKGHDLIVNAIDGCGGRLPNNLGWSNGHPFPNSQASVLAVVLLSWKTQPMWKENNWHVKKWIRNFEGKRIKKYQTWYLDILKLGLCYIESWEVSIVDHHRCFYWLLYLLTFSGPRLVTGSRDGTVRVGSSNHSFEMHRWKLVDAPMDLWMMMDDVCCFEVQGEIDLDFFLNHLQNLQE